MSGGEPCRLLEWDSSHFHKRIARVEAPRLSPESLPEILRWCGDRAVDCVYFLADAGDAASVALAEGAGFRLVDLRVTLDHDLQAAPPPAEGVRIRGFAPDDLPRLCSIARHAHTGTRFFRDSSFPRERSEELYEIWIRKSCAGEAGAVWVAEHDGAAAGYVTCQRVDAGEGKIGLLAVAPEAQGQGAGRALVDEALRWFSRQQARRASVVAQGANLPALRLYQKSGFCVTSVQLWYHRWFAGGATR